MPGDDIKRFNAAVRASGLWHLRHDVSAYLHGLKASGERGSAPNGDFTFGELGEILDAFKSERGLDVEPEPSAEEDLEDDD